VVTRCGVRCSRLVIAAFDERTVKIEDHRGYVHRPHIIRRRSR